MEIFPDTEVPLFFFSVGASVGPNLSAQEIFILHLLWESGRNGLSLMHSGKRDFLIALATDLGLYPYPKWWKVRKRILAIGRSPRGIL